MAFRGVSAILRFHSPNSIQLNKTINNSIEVRRYFGRKSKAAKKATPDNCPNTSCKKPPPPKKLSFWKRACAEEKPKPLPPKETCKVEQDRTSALVPVTFEQTSEINSHPTGGLIPKDVFVMTSEREVEQKEEKPKPSDIRLPNFLSVEERLLFYSDNKLHPLHDVYKNIRKRQNLGLPERPSYITRSGPIEPEEIPQKLKINESVLKGQKTIGYYQSVEPLQPIVAKVAELRKNEKPTMESIVVQKKI